MICSACGHALNSLEISSEDVIALSRIPQSAEIPVSKVIVHCSKEFLSHANPISGNPVVVRIGVEDIDMGLITQVCPNVNRLDIFTYHSCSLLWVTQKLIRSLPCSPIRDWPLLRVDVEIQDSIVSDDDKFDIREVDGEKRVTYGTGGPRGRICNTGWLEAPSGFRLGHEIPGRLNTIQVYGILSQRLCHKLENHRCSFGDCSFEKENVPPMLPAACSETTDGISASAQHVRYTWHKTGEVIPQSEEQEAKVIAAMNQWVPKLSPEDYVSLLPIHRVYLHSSTLLVTGTSDSIIVSICTCRCLHLLAYDC